MEAPEQFEAEKLLFCLLTSRFLPNPALEPSEAAAVEAPEQFEAAKLLFCMPTSRFLPNPAPEPSEPDAVEAPEQFEAEKRLFCLPTSSLLPNPAPEPSEPTAVEAPEQFEAEKLLLCLPRSRFCQILLRSLPNRPPWRLRSSLKRKSYCFACREAGSAKSCSGGFRTGRRGGSGAV